jgi:uncharacterized OsmC-like protein
MTAATPPPFTDDDDHRRIAAALARLRATMGKRPGFGHSTRTAVAVLADGLRCSISEGSSRIESDLAPALGGSGTAPSPSTLVRAALGACLAMGYRMHAAELGVEVASVRVTVESESQLCGMLDPGADEPPGLTAISYHVEIESPATEDEVARVIELGDRLSPVLDMLVRPHAIDRTVSITTSPTREPVS